MGTSFDTLKLLGQESKGKPSIKSFCEESHSGESFWFHFSIENPVACNWLREKSGVDPLIVETMLSSKVRPRFVEKGDSLLLILRVADTLDMNQHEELRSIRIYADSNRVISTSLYNLPVIKEVLSHWKEGIKAEDLFMELATNSVKGLEMILDDLDDRMDELEKIALEVGKDPNDYDLSAIALDGLNLRGCLAPQREVFASLVKSDVSWIESSKRNTLMDIYERVSRQLAETEALRDRARIIRNEIDAHVAEQVNRRLYVFSIVALIFLPLSFLTGLLGVNLGGIPGAEHPNAFYLFSGSLVLLAVIAILTLKRFRWL